MILNGGRSPGRVIGAMGGILRAAELVAAGTLRPVINRVYPLGDTATRLRDIEAGHVRGKVGITVR